MYLNLLKENQKKLFISLAYNLAFADGDYSDEEKNLINGYCQEMQIVFEENSIVESMDDIIDEILRCASEQEKKIFIFELIGLAMIDGDYDENERILIKKIEDKIQIESGYAESCEGVINEYITFQEKLNLLVLSSSGGR